MIMSPVKGCCNSGPVKGSGSQSEVCGALHPTLQSSSDPHGDTSFVRLQDLKILSGESSFKSFETRVLTLHHNTSQTYDSSTTCS